MHPTTWPKPGQYGRRVDAEFDRLRIGSRIRESQHLRALLTEAFELICDRTPNEHELRQLATHFFRVLNEGLPSE